MFETMRRLHPRGAASKGVCVDADGALLGPACVLVRRTPDGYRGVSRAESRPIQRLLLAATDDPDWLYEQGQRIAQALDRGEVALAQIYGLRIPVNDLDGAQLKRLAALAATAKMSFNPAQPRAPAGQPDGGRWIDAGGGTATGPQVDLTGVRSDDGGGTRLQPHPIGVRSDTDHAGDGGTAGLKAPLIEARFDIGHVADGEAPGLHTHLIEAGYSLDRAEWRVVKELYRLFMNPDNTLASLMGYLEERGLNLRELPSVIRSLFDPPRPLAELQTTKPPRGFDTEAQLKAYLGPPLPGYEWHHIIEQGGQWRPDLTSPEGVRTWIQHTVNMVMVPVIKHYCINALMSSRFGDLKWREIVKPHGPVFQRWMGEAFLKTCRVI